MKANQSGNQRMKVDILFLLDRSGSMLTMQKGVVSGYNEFLEGQKMMRDGDGNLCDVRFSFVLFSHDSEVVLDRVKIDQVEKMEKFVPVGSTSLNDAFCDSVDRLRMAIGGEVAAEHPEMVIVAILTDGEENTSRRFHLSDVKNRISELREKGGWEFLFLGAHEDAFLESGNMGILSGDFADFTADSDGVKSAFDRIQAMALRKVRKPTGRKINWFADDEESKPVEEKEGK